jgi:hypothetical protein
MMLGVNQIDDETYTVTVAGGICVTFKKNVHVDLLHVKDYHVKVKIWDTIYAAPGYESEGDIVVEHFGELTQIIDVAIWNDVKTYPSPIKIMVDRVSGLINRAEFEKARALMREYRRDGFELHDWSVFDARMSSVEMMVR